MIMQPNRKKPVYRKVIVPWYDSTTSCLVTLLVMAVVLLLGLSGVFVAMENPEYQRHIWVPTIFVILSGSVIISIIVRLIARYAASRQHSLNRFRFPDFEYPDKKTGK